MNRFYENMGIYSSVRSATEQDALAQMTEWTYNFGEAIREGGLTSPKRPITSCRSLPVARCRVLLESPYGSRGQRSVAPGCAG